MKHLSLAALLFFITGITSINAQNYSLDFDGTNDYVSIGTISGFTESVSVEALIYPSSIPSNYPPIIKSTDEFALEIDHTNSEIKFHVKIGGGWAASPGYVIPDLSTWYHVAGVYDGSDIRLYIDGTEIGTATGASGAIASSATNVELGRDPSNTSRLFDGMIDEVRIWNVARTQTQINDNRQVELSGNETGLVAYYDMNEGSGTTLTNRSRTTSPSYNGTINGATWVTGIDFPMILTYTIPSNGYTIGLPFGVNSNDYVNVAVDWGDGNTESFTQYGEKTHTYSTAGTYTVKINGTLDRFGSYLDNYESTGIAALNSIETYGNIGIEAINTFVNGAGNLSAIPAQIPASVTSLRYAFRYATTFNLDISGWDVSNVTNLQGTFDGASVFNQDISGWDVSNVTSLYFTFQNATSFNQDIGNWDVSNVTTFGFAFNGASAFDQNLGSWDFSAANSASWRMGYMIQSVALSYTNYNALLISLSNQTIPSNVNFGNWSSYTGAAVSARNYLINTKGWSFYGDSQMPITWDGSTDSDWYTDGNWDVNFVPTSDENVVIADVTNDPVIPYNGQTTVNNLTVNTGASLTLESGGSLITNGTITNNGAINIEKSISDGEWHLISVPNAVTTANTFLGDYLQYWTENGQTWTDIVDPATALTPAKGYALFGVAKNTTYTFTGTPNTGNQSISLSYHNATGDSDGMNLVGNPYPSSIDWATLHASYGAAYLWDPSAASGQGDYIENTSGDIAPMQAFFIYSTNNGSNFSLSNSNRSHGGSFYKSSETIAHGLVLTGSNGSYDDEWTLLLDDEAELSFNLTNDAWKILSSGESISQIWSICPDGKLAIDKRPYTESIQLGFSNHTSGKYAIGAKQIEGITIAQLEDTKLKLIHDLTKGAYTFDWNTTDSEERFVLHLKATGTEEMETQAVRIYSAAGQVYVSQNELEPFTEMMIYDLSGRLVYQTPLKTQSLQSFELSHLSGIYLIQLTNKNQSLTEKVILK